MSIDEVTRWVEVQRGQQFQGNEISDFNAQFIELDLRNWDSSRVVDLADAPALVRVVRTEPPSTRLQVLPPVGHELEFCLAGPEPYVHEIDLCLTSVAPRTIRFRGEPEAQYRVLHAPAGVRLHVDVGRLLLPEDVEAVVVLNGGSLELEFEEARALSVVVATSGVLSRPPRRFIGSIELYDDAVLTVVTSILVVDAIIIGSTATINTAPGGPSATVEVGRVSSPNRDASIELGESVLLELATVSDLRVHGGGTLRLAANASVQALTIELPSLLLPSDIELTSISGSARHLGLGPHVHISVEPGSLVVGQLDGIDPTAVIEGLGLPEDASQALKLLRRLENLQSVSIPLGETYGKSSLTMKEAKRIERVVDAGARLAQRRSNDGRNRTAWHMQQLQVRYALARNPLDRGVLWLRLRSGDAHDVSRCFAVWLALVAVSTFLLIYAIGSHPVFQPGTWSAWVITFRALGLAVFSVFKLIPVGTDGTGLPTPAAWALLLKIPLTLSLASLVASIVRRVRWVPHDE